MARICIADKECVCRVCGNTFLAKYRGTRVCGEVCRNARELAQWHERRAASGQPTKGSTVPCGRCGESLMISSGHTKFCAACRRVEDAEKAKRYRARHVDIVRQRQKEIDERRKTCPKRRESVRKSSNKRGAMVRATPRGTLDHRMSQLVRNGLNGTKNGRKWEALVGYTIADLMAHLERQFTKGMTWANVREWHVDHIIPKSSFQYVTPDDLEFRACWALTNLRPLWSGENLSKGAKRLLLI